MKKIRPVRRLSLPATGVKTSESMEGGVSMREVAEICILS